MLVLSYILLTCVSLGRVGNSLCARATCVVGSLVLLAFSSVFSFPWLQGNNSKHSANSQSLSLSLGLSECLCQSVLTRAKAPKNKLHGWTLVNGHGTLWPLSKPQPWRNNKALGLCHSKVVQPATNMASAAGHPCSRKVGSEMRS